MQQADMEVYVLVSGFDPLFSNTVMQRTSYTYKEVVWGGKFRPMYHESADGSTTIVDLDKLEEYEQVELLQAAV
jgi:inward rectifier potassium channel